MGFDFRSVSPRFGKTRPEPIAHDERDEERGIYSKEELEEWQAKLKEWEQNTPYVYFRLGGGSWGPILKVLEEVNEECQLGIDMSGWHHNDYAYSGNWHVVQTLAEKTMQHKEEEVKTIPGFAAFIIYMQNSGGFVIG